MCILQSKDEETWYKRAPCHPMPRIPNQMQTLQNLAEKKPRAISSYSMPWDQNKVSGILQLGFQEKKFAI